jgi:cyclase
MVAKRIIPCLDIRGGRTVKGVQFQALRDAGDPVELAVRYVDEGADELVFLDISATDEERATMADVVRRVAAVLTIPLTVGGGIRSASDVSALLEAGADKVSLNSSAVRSPNLVDELARRFGSQCVVVAIDSKRDASGADEVFVQAGKQGTGKNSVEWAREVVERGAGEVLLTSMDHDGTRGGFALELTLAVSEAVCVPVIASGGAGEAHHFTSVFRDGLADAALAAGIFHDRVMTIGEVKSALQGAGIEVRL